MTELKVLEEEINNAITEIVNNNEITNKEFDIIKEWYDKTNEKKDKKAIITEHILPMIIKYATPYLLNVFVENLTVKSEFIKDGMVSNIEFDLTPVKPYVDIVLKADGAKLHSIRFTFQVDTHVTINNLRFAKDKPHISIENVTFKITLSLIKIVNDIEPLEIGSKEFVISNLSL